MTQGTQISEAAGALGGRLNADQRSAVEALRGPVCILAGAGSGKTTTITHRIAHQVSSGTFGPHQILAVTFTDKAAREMRNRLAALGVTGVNARTFHAAALAQLRHLSPHPVGEILSSKAALLRQIGNGLPRPYRYRPAGDLATEIEWAKNRRVGVDGYLDSLGDHQPPIPADLMHGVFRLYESRKERNELWDFEDLLEWTIRMYDEVPAACERFRAKYASFTVDEFQDVNLLQHTLLDRWLGPRDDICAVGDDYQAIYGFTGATPRYLLELPRRRPNTRVIRLEKNYRSTPQVLDLANRLVLQLGGAAKVLEPVNAAGPAPVARSLVDEQAEIRFVVDEVRELSLAGTRFEEIAVLYRLNYRSEEFEAAFVAAGIPYQVRDGTFLSRAAARRVLSVLRRSPDARPAEAVRKLAVREGWKEEPDADLGERELTRQNDLGRLVRLAAEFDEGATTAAAFVADLEARFGGDGDARGVNLLTYHRAKGLEFDAVFLPRLNENELPHKRSLEGEALAEERRLLYVGITRARRVVTLSWLTGGRMRPSRFVYELGLAAEAHAAARPVKSPDGPAARALREWRLQRAHVAGVPPYVIFNDATLREIAARLPSTLVELSGINGIGPLRLDAYGREILAALAPFAPLREDDV